MKRKIGNMVEEESYTCPKCGMTSYHPEDIKHKYCGNCHMTREEVMRERLGGIYMEYRKGESGIRVRGQFISFLKEGQEIDVIACVPWRDNLVPGAKKGTCDQCGQDIALAPSTQLVMKEHPNALTRCIYCLQKQLEEEQKKKEA